MASVQQVPTSLRPIAHYIKIANENAARDPIIYYWCLYYAVQAGMQLDKKSPDALQYLTSLLSTLEATKKQLVGQEALTQDMVAQAHVENFAIKLFEYADKNDRQSNFSKNVVKAFYTAGHLIDVLTLFGELDESLVANRKYAKWKATYIHNCLKNGETPEPGPPGNQDDELDNLDLLIPPTGPSLSGGGMPHAPGPGPEEGSSGAPTQPFAPPRPTSPPQYPSPAPRSMPESAAKPKSLNPSSDDMSKHKMDDFIEAQKYAKYAVSSLSYEDAASAIDNMQKAMQILAKYT